MELTGAQALIKSLEMQHVEVMFGLPGGAILPVYDPILDSSIRHILVRHEQGAGHMAQGYAQVTGRPGRGGTSGGRLAGGGRGQRRRPPRRDAGDRPGPQPHAGHGPSGPARRRYGHLGATGGLSCGARRATMCTSCRHVAFVPRFWYS